MNESEANAHPKRMKRVMLMPRQMMMMMNNPTILPLNLNPNLNPMKMMMHQMMNSKHPKRASPLHVDPKPKSARVVPPLLHLPKSLPNKRSVLLLPLLRGKEQKRAQPKQPHNAPPIKLLPPSPRMFYPNTKHPAYPPSLPDSYTPIVLHESRQQLSWGNWCNRVNTHQTS